MIVVAEMRRKIKESLMRVCSRVMVMVFAVFLLAACGDKDEGKAAENRPAIPGYE